MAATAVVKGDMTLGMMLAVQYIVGQLNAPVEQMLTFIHSAQNAKISLERLNEIYKQQDEKPAEMRSRELTGTHGIEINNVTFQYEGAEFPKVLQDISVVLPEKKVTAIVGASGSGKTTLLKLMLGFYPVSQGEIRIGDSKLDSLNFSQRRISGRWGKLVLPVFRLRWMG